MRVKDVFDPKWLLNPAKVFPLASAPRGARADSRRGLHPRTPAGYLDRHERRDAPRDEAELAEAVAGREGPLRVAAAARATLGHAAGEVLETGGLTGVELYEPGALTLVVRAGTPLAEVEAVLAGERQRLAFEPSDLRALLGRTGESTIGGVVAANASGPRRVQVGGVRAISLLGVRFVDGTGTVDQERRAGDEERHRL